MTTTGQSRKRRLPFLPPPPAPESTLDAKAGIRRTRIATWAFIALTIGAAAMRWYTVYAMTLLGVVIANGRNDWYRGWIAGYEARRQQHLQQLNG